MPSKSIILSACAISFIGLVSGNPVVARLPRCSPNFEGAGISVVNGGREWGVQNPVGANSAVTSKSPRGLFTEADFRFEQTGQATPSYIIKPIGKNELPVSVSGGTLKLSPINAGDQSQIWLVECDFCKPGASTFRGEVASGCQIKSKPTGQCVQLGAQSTDPLVLATCGHWQGNQAFDFWTETPPN